MDIKVLTFHNELNYGANLQAFALSTYLKDCGHSVSFINYQRFSENNGLVSFIKKWFGKSIKATRMKIIQNKREIIRNRELTPIFCQFQHKHIRPSGALYTSYEEIRENPPGADCYIVGSDQVWSSKLISVNDMPVFYLDFGPKNVKRIAYAVSSGGEPISLDHHKARDSLMNFDAIGAREKEMVDELHMLGIAKAEWVPDPTILIDWNNFVDLQSVKKDKRVAVFILNKQNYSKVSLHGHSCDEEMFQTSTMYRDLSAELNDPLEWIASIATVKLLITDSYHAVLFAVYTNTPFVFLRWGQGVKRDARIMGLLKKLDLEKRAVLSIDIGTIDSEWFAPKSWDDINAKLKEMQNLAKNFIQRSISM